ncbi:MAG: OmpA family protein [Bacteroidales bacterium]|nr:OmpA family protein [Bacteroidales bacterium]
MKKVFRFITVLSLIIGLSFTSCVSSKKFMASEARVDKLQKDNAITLGQLNECNAQAKILYGEKANLQNENAQIQNDLSILSTESKTTIADQAKRLKALQDMIQSQKNIMANLQNAIAEALMNYKTDELSIYIKDGKVYVSLEEKLLFKSGSDVVNPQGKEALITLAKVLNGTKDITVMIEGHTDDVPIKTNQFRDNWDLSTARANSVVRILTTDNGFDPTRITASGRGKFHPVKSNETTEGRAANRRTEVILSPDLQELYKLLFQ